MRRGGMSGSRRWRWQNPERGGRTMRILTLLVRHGVENYGAALSDLASIYQTRFPSVNQDLLIIDNALKKPLERTQPPVIRGSNRAWEFSGWDEGLAHVGGAVEGYDWVHLVTSAFNTLYTRYID